MSIYQSLPLIQTDNGGVYQNVPVTSDELDTLRKAMVARVEDEPRCNELSGAPPPDNLPKNRYLPGSFGRHRDIAFLVIAFSSHRRRFQQFSCDGRCFCCFVLFFFTVLRASIAQVPSEGVRQSDLNKEVGVSGVGNFRIESTGKVIQTRCARGFTITMTGFLSSPGERIRVAFHADTRVYTETRQRREHSR